MFRKFPRKYSNFIRSFNYTNQQFTSFRKCKHNFFAFQKILRKCKKYKKAFIEFPSIESFLICWIFSNILQHMQIRNTFLIIFPTYLIINYLSYRQCLRACGRITALEIWLKIQVKNLFGPRNILVKRSLGQKERSCPVISILTILPIR